MSLVCSIMSGEEDWKSGLGLKEFLDVHTVRHYSKYTTRPNTVGRLKTGGNVFVRRILFWFFPSSWSSPTWWCAAVAASIAHIATVTRWYFATECVPASSSWLKSLRRRKAGACRDASARWTAAWQREESMSAMLPVVTYLSLCVAYAFVASAAGDSTMARRETAPVEEDDEDDDDQCLASLDDDDEDWTSPAPECSSSWQNSGLGPVKVTMWREGRRIKVAMTLTELRSTLLSAASIAEDAEHYFFSGKFFHLCAATLFAIARPCHILASQAPTRFAPIALTSTACAWMSAFAAVSMLSKAYSCYRRRLRYAKLYAATTSSRRARSKGVPYLSLRKVENLKVWLALRGGRGFLKSFDSERHADAVCSTAFHACAGLTVVLLALYFRDHQQRRFPDAAFHFELLVAWALCAAYIISFVGLGSRVNARYSDATTLYVEMINIQLRLQSLTCVQPASTTRLLLPSSGRNTRTYDTKDALSSSVAATIETAKNGPVSLEASASSPTPPPRYDASAKKIGLLRSSLAVLKLAAKLLKDVDSPSKVSGFAMDPVFYNVVRCVFYSALSAMLSEWLGLDLKLKPSYFK